MNRFDFQINFGLYVLLTIKCNSKMAKAKRKPALKKAVRKPGVSFLAII